MLHAEQPGQVKPTLSCFGLPVVMCAGEFTVNSAQEVEKDTCLSTQEMAVDSHTNPSMVRVYLKQSKTDPFRPGVYIFLGHRCCAKPSGSHLGLLCHSQPIDHLQGRLATDQG